MLSSNVGQDTTGVKGGFTTITSVMSEKVPKSQAVSVRFDLDQLEVLDGLAEKERLDRSALVRRLVDEALAARKLASPVSRVMELSREMEARLTRIEERLGINRP